MIDRALLLYLFAKIVPLHITRHLTHAACILCRIAHRAPN